jgi:hypothetical protein
MTLLVQTPDKEESKEYLIPPQSPDCNEDNRLESNREDQYSHMKILWNGKSNIMEDLEEQFNENIYLILE